MATMGGWGRENAGQLEALWLLCCISSQQETALWKTPFCGPLHLFPLKWSLFETSLPNINGSPWLEMSLLCPDQWPISFRTFPVMYDESECMMYEESEFLLLIINYKHIGTIQTKLSTLNSHWLQGDKLSISLTLFHWNLWACNIILTSIGTCSVGFSVFVGYEATLSCRLWKQFG